MNRAIKYSITVLLLSWASTFALSSNSDMFLKNFAIIMFIPGLVAIVFSIIQYKSVKPVFKCLMTKFSLKSILFAIGYPVAVVGICAIIAGLTGLAKLNYDSLHNLFSIRGIITLVVVIIVNCVTGSLGEELGWRGYLLPLVTENKGKLKGTLWVSTVWALYHIPALFLLAKVTGVGNPLLVAIVQGCMAFLASFAFSYCFFLSNSLYPVLILHALWNYINTKTLGDVYTNVQGIMEGNIFYINGEGILGLIIIGIASVWFMKKLKDNSGSTRTLRG